MSKKRTSGTEILFRFALQEELKVSGTNCDMTIGLGTLTSLLGHMLDHFAHSVSKITGSIATGLLIHFLNF